MESQLVLFLMDGKWEVYAEEEDTYAVPIRDRYDSDVEKTIRARHPEVEAICFVKVCGHRFA